LTRLTNGIETDRALHTRHVLLKATTRQYESRRNPHMRLQSPEQHVHVAVSTPPTRKNLRVYYPLVQTSPNLRCLSLIRPP